MSKAERTDTNETVVNAKPWFLRSISDTAEALDTDVENGLKNAQVATFQNKYGANELLSGGGVNPWSILAGQIFNAMVLVLILAFAVSLGIKSWIEGGVIAAVIIINIVVGFFQEYSSAKTMDSLRSLASPTAHVIRDGKVEVIPNAKVTVGDLVEVKTGDVVPADLRLTDTMNFEADEALLTGESMPVAKDCNASWDKEAEVDPRDVGVGDRINMAYASTTVTKGRARGIVVAIGMKTEIGAIAESLRGGDTKVRKVRKNEDGKAPFHRYLSAWGLTVTDNIGSFLGVNKGTPLQRMLSWLAIMLFFIAVIFAIVVFAANGFDTRQEIAIYAVATGVSMIPASLVVVLTLTLAGGTRAMVARHVIIRKLDSLEAVGAVTTICSDKTGTLTMGKMIVRAAWVPSSKGLITVGETSEAFNPTLGDLTVSSKSPAETASDKSTSNKAPEALDKEAIVKDSSAFRDFLNVASMCNIAKVLHGDEGWSARGDPTECAIQVFAHRFDWGRESFTKGDSPRWTQLAEYPFDSDLKRMSVIFKRNEDGERFAFMKGAVERMFDASKEFLFEDGPRTLDEQLKETILSNVEALASQGLRVLALAHKPLGNSEIEAEMPRDQVEKDMTILGLVGIYDPPRPETKASVRECHEAGIEVRMCTGDHVATARAIALQVGILPRNMHTMSKEVVSAMVKTASEFDRMSDDEIDAMPILPLVLARCAPHTKVRMIDALHRRKGNFVAMTGDGVNDAPALKRADVGVAMGQAGSDVAKDAADIVLTDDNFSSIVAAVEEGRRLFDNIQKFVLHLLAQNVSQACVLLIGLAFKDTNGLSVFPIAPVPILWIIMVTSSLPSMGLGMLKARAGIMQRPPVSLKMGIFQWEVVVDMIVYGLIGAAFSLAAFALVVYGFGNGDLGIDSNNTLGNGSDQVFRARSACFSVLVFFSLWLAIEVMDHRRSFFLMTPGTAHPWTQWVVDLYSEKFIFWTLVFGIVSLFPLIYIPGLNDVVLKQIGISWELGIVFICWLCIIVSTELWKWGKRVYYRHHKQEEESATDRIFGRWETTMTKDPAREV